MATKTTLAVTAGATLSQSFTVADTGARTYSITVMDRWHNELTGLGFDVAVVNGTTIAVQLSSTDSDNLSTPTNIPFGQWTGTFGRYIIEENNAGTITRVYYGDITLDRNKR